jgi:hypothetical protein
MVKLHPFPGVPQLSWILRERVCDPYRDNDATILITGPKGSGKSVFSLALAEELANQISRVTHLPPSTYFSIDNCRSVDRHGSMQLLTSDVLKRKNSIVIIDDAQISIGARRSPTLGNQMFNDILTIARPYRCTLLINCVFSGTIDKIARSLADYVISIVHSDTYTKQTVVKVYRYEVSDDGTEYKKFLRWGNKRIKYWIGTLPSPELLKQYQELRKQNTDTFVSEMYDRVVKMAEPVPKVRKGGVDQFVAEKGVAVRADYLKIPSIKGLARKYGTTEYKINRCLSGETASMR